MPCFVHRHVLEGCTLEGLKCGITAFVFLFFLCSPHLVTAAEDPALQDQDELYQKTLSIDIDTAGDYELLSWCETLGLDTRGGREELAQRLRGFYHLAFEHVKEEATQDFSKKKGKSITISKAESVQSFTLEIVDETYVRLSGGVILTMKDEETTHIIEADTVVLNQTESTITAFGSIRYTMEKGGKKEYFNGESLTFSIDDLSGFFYKGFSEKNQKIGDKEIIFYYSGNSMYRSSQNIITLKDGIITSCKEPEPHYSIHATKIWVLAPGEWALKSGTLYLGYVPVAYIPAFFKPGDTFFFNPALGYRSREGYFLQTTTYLLGEKEQTASGISFLQVGDDGSTRYATEREGLFLKKTEAISAAKHEPGKIRLMVDAYSRLGYFTGISADFEDKGFLQSLSLTAGIALSRSLFAQSDGTYSPLYEFSDGTVGSIWNHSNFFGISIPFRYGIDLSFVLHSPHASVTGSIPFYSDKYFKRDFLKRSESMDWNSLLFSQGTTTDSDDLPSTLTLSLDTALTPDISAVKPYIERLELTSLKIALNENSKTNASYLPEEGFFSTFYYPDTYVLPSMNLFMSGTLFSTEGKESAEKKTSSVDPRARQPEYEGMEDETAESAPQVAADESSLRTPFKRPPLPIEVPIQQEREFFHSLSYTFSPQLAVNTVMQSSDWLEPADIDYQPAYSILNLQGNSSLKYEAHTSDSSFSFQDTVSLSSNYKNHYNLSEEEEAQSDAYLLADKKVSYLKVSDNLLMNIHPFYSLPNISTSSLVYTMGFTLYELSYDSTLNDMEGNLVTWDSEFIKVHKLDLTLNLDAFSSLQTLNIATILPPLDAEFAPSLVMRSGNLTTTASCAVKEDPESGEWESDPFSLTGRYGFLSDSFVQQKITYDFEKGGFAMAESQIFVKTIDEKISFSQSFSFDIDQLKPLDSVSTLKLWMFYASFQATETYPYTFVPGSGWAKGSDVSFLPYSLSAGTKYTYDSGLLWKNRLSYSLSVDSSLAMNLVTYTNAIFNFDLSFSLHIFQFLDFRIESKSYNKAFYRYFPHLAENLGVGATSENIITDLLKSFNFFSRQDREESSFKLQSIDVSLIHRLHDWDLSFTYSGRPELDEEKRLYVWNPTFTILLQWNPIPEIKKTITYDEGLNL